MSHRRTFGPIWYDDWGKQYQRGAKESRIDRIRHTYRTRDWIKCPDCEGILEVTTVDGRLVEHCLNPEHAKGRPECA